MLDLMKMDMANFTIQQIRPYLQQQSMEYEKTKFEEFLKTQRGKRKDFLIDIVHVLIIFFKSCRKLYKMKLDLNNIKQIYMDMTQDISLY